MKKILYFATILLLFSSCITFNTVFPSGRITSEIRNVDYFEKISVSSGIQLVAYNGRQEVTVETYENIQDYVETYVRNNCLYIRPQNQISFGGNARITVYVTAELIKSIDASGGSKVEIPGLLRSNELSLNGSGGAKFDCENSGEIHCNRLFVDIAGGGKADLHVDCAYMDISSSGGGKLELQGLADVVDMNMSGGGKIEAYYLGMVELYAQMSGGACAEVNVSEAISGNLAGGSKIYYKGNPRVSVNTSGGSKVIAD